MTKPNWYRGADLVRELHRQFHENKRDENPWVLHLVRTHVVRVATVTGYQFVEERIEIAVIELGDGWVSGNVTHRGIGSEERKEVVRLDDWERFYFEDL